MAAYVQKKPNPRRFWQGGAPWVVATVILLTGAFWFYNREPPAITLDYGNLKLLLQDQTGAVQFKNVKVGRTEIRGEIVTTDEVSDGGLAPVRQTQTKSF